MNHRDVILILFVARVIGKKADLSEMERNVALNRLQDFSCIVAQTTITSREKLNNNHQDDVVLGRSRDLK